MESGDLGCLAQLGNADSPRDLPFLRPEPARGSSWSKNPSPANSRNISGAEQRLWQTPPLGSRDPRHRAGCVPCTQRSGDPLPPPGDSLSPPGVPHRLLSSSVSQQRDAQDIWDKLVLSLTPGRIQIRPLCSGYFSIKTKISPNNPTEGFYFLPFLIFFFK